MIAEELPDKRWKIYVATSKTGKHINQEKNFMAKIKTRRVQVIEADAKYVTLLFLDQHCQIQLPRLTFLHRKELGLYEILNPEFMKPAV
ncbi:hypothetical protein IX84_21445 [Phaeodactylibacter xiamenensis]|uniref:Uncharacterized protein n=2 Tax=Phaeodactylibacter xiamenensis TaxID=1524460 RepID=A0A098S201_9BACT|nr:hypothetical protein IX84_21445 [Phaeodactylibacter xiamenensis]